MRAYVDIDRIDLSLSPAQRTALGLGPIANDPRDAAIRGSVCMETPTEIRCVGSVVVAFERAATTRSALRTLLVDAARVRVAADRDAKSEAQAFAVGTRIEIPD